MCFHLVVWFVFFFTQISHTYRFKRRSNLAVLMVKRQRSLGRNITPKYLFETEGHVPKQSRIIDDWCVEKHQRYIYNIGDRLLEQACLQKDYRNRPHMSLIYEKITNMKSELEML